MKDIIEHIREIVKVHEWSTLVEADKPRVILLGESHYSQRCQDAQELLFRIMRPNIVLHECLNTLNYDPLTGELTGLEYPFIIRYSLGSKEYYDLFPEREKYSEQFKQAKNQLYKDSYVGWGYKLSDEQGFLFKGCDMSFRKRDKLGKLLLKQYSGTSISKLIEMVDHFREVVMGKIILQNVTLTDKILLAIFGADHINLESPIHKQLKNKHVPYCCYNQVSK